MIHYELLLLMQRVGTQFFKFPNDDIQPGTLYYYDKNNFMRPAKGRIPDDNEQTIIDDYNLRRAVLNEYDRQWLDKYMAKNFPGFPPAPLPLDLSKISDTVDKQTTAARNWVPPRRDPLVLDLNGGGITTSGINPNAPILFDENGDGTRTATGWIGAGEAIVVRDLNGNGTIDSGRELFGDNTILTNGPKAGQTAANGFEALADLDADANGVADGKFDSNDVAYSSVRLWQDANQDGVSQANELHTFEELGVASINVAAAASNVNLGGGNTQSWSGSFTRTDGTTGDSGTAQLAGSLLLAGNNFYREFTDDLAPMQKRWPCRVCGECCSNKRSHFWQPRLPESNLLLRSQRPCGTRAGCLRTVSTKWLGSFLNPRGAIFEYQ